MHSGKMEESANLPSGKFSVATFADILNGAYDDNSETDALSLRYSRALDAVKYLVTDVGRSDGEYNDIIASSVESVLSAKYEGSYMDIVSAADNASSYPECKTNAHYNAVAEYIKATPAFGRRRLKIVAKPVEVRKFLVLLSEYDTLGAISMLVDDVGDSDGEFHDILDSSLGSVLSQDGEGSYMDIVHAADNAGSYPECKTNSNYRSVVRYMKHNPTLAYRMF